VDASSRARGPFAWAAQGHEGRLFAALTLALALLSIALSAIGRPLITAAAPAGIVSFELAGDAARAARILGSWAPVARERAMLSLGLDYLYLVVYPAWFSLACVLLARRSRGALGRIGALLAWAVLAAGLFDAVENAALIRMLDAGASQAAAQLARTCAAAKFALLLVAAAYLLAAAGAWALRRAVPGMR
jgi:hypothetical protein